MDLIYYNQQVPFYTTMLLDKLWTVLVGVSSYLSLPLLDSKTHDCDMYMYCMFMHEMYIDLYTYIDLMVAFKGVAIPMKISQ